MKRTVVASLLAIGLAGSLTACDPPMPPSVLAQLSEQTYTCVEGAVKVSSPKNLTDAISQIGVSLSAACVDPLPTMTLETSSADKAELMITDRPIAASKVFLTVPFAVEAADVAFNLSVSTSLNLSAKSVAGIFNGKITSWDDPAIVAENPDIEMPAEPILVRKTAEDLAFSSLNGWLKQFGQAITSPVSIESKSSTPKALGEGEIAILPHSVNQGIGGSSASIVVSKKSGNLITANSDIDGIGAAATQWVVTKTANSVQVKLDYKKPVTIPDGNSSAAIPYQAIYPVYLQGVGTDSLLKRAVATFLLRLDSQGGLGASVYNPVDENTRVNAVAIARIGLPAVKLPKKK